MKSTLNGMQTVIEARKEGIKAKLTTDGCFENKKRKRSGGEGVSEIGLLINVYIQNT